MSERGMYGISKNGKVPYLYLDYAPEGQWSEYGDQLIAVNRRQQPDARFEMVGPFTDADREWHLANPENWETGVEEWDLNRGPYSDAIANLIGGLAEVWRMP